MTFPVFNTLKNRIGNTPADKRWKVAISMFFPEGKEILSKFHLTAAMARELSQILPEDKPNMYIHAAFWQSVISPPPLEFKSPDWDDGTGWCWSNALIGFRFQMWHQHSAGFAGRARIATDAPLRYKQHLLHRSGWSSTSSSFPQNIYIHIYFFLFCFVL